MLIIMTTWIGMFLQTGLKTLHWKTYHKTEIFWQWWITLSNTVDFLKKRQEWIWDKKNNMSSLMTKYHIEIPSPLPFKPVLLEKMCGANIPKKYVIEEMITAARYSVLRLHPIIVCLTQMEWFGTNWNIMLDIWIYTQVYYQKL